MTKPDLGSMIAQRKTNKRRRSRSRSRLEVDYQTMEECHKRYGVRIYNYSISSFGQNARAVIMNLVDHIVRDGDINPDDIEQVDVRESHHRNFYKKCTKIPYEAVPEDRLRDGVCFDIPCILARDAQLIAMEGSGGRELTILCVALKEGDTIRKYAFSNTGSVSGTMLREMDRKGYDFIKTGKSHAEIGLLQFLYTRRERGDFTHVVGIGCNRKYCQECDHLLKVFLGEGYRHVAAVGRVKIDSDIEDDGDSEKEG